MYAPSCVPSPRCPSGSTRGLLADLRLSTNLHPRLTTDLPMAALRAQMRELVRRVHATQPPSEHGTSWLERPEWDARLSTVEAIYRDRGSRYPTLPWHEDSYRRCEYTVDWETGLWEVDDSRCSTPKEECQSA